MTFFPFRASLYRIAMSPRFVSRIEMTSKPYHSLEIEYKQWKCCFAHSKRLSSSRAPFHQRRLSKDYYESRRLFPVPGPRCRPRSDLSYRRLTTVLPPSYYCLWCLSTTQYCLWSLPPYNSPPYYIRPYVLQSISVACIFLIYIESF